MNHSPRSLGVRAAGPLIWLCLSLCGCAPLRETTVGRHPSLPPPVVPECLGVNIHFIDPQPGELEMLAAAGFKWVRMDLTWSATEMKPGTYDFSAYDRLVAALEKHGLRALFILDYGNPLYAEPGDQHPFTSRAGTVEFREAFGKWAVAAVSHFKGRGYLWDLWNEPNHDGFWKPKPNVAEYSALAKATGAALRKAGLLGRQGEAFIGPATSTIDLPFIEECFKAGLLEYWDAVSVHPYRQQAPETVEEEYHRLRLLIRHYAPPGKDIPIISGEWGYSDGWAKFDRGKQAKYLPRQFLTNLANDVALSIWYDWRDDGTNPTEPEHHFGLVGHEYHAGRDPVFDPKPAYTAMKTLTEQLGGFRFNKALATNHPQPTLRLFTRGDEVRLAFHNPDPDRNQGDVILSAGDGAFRHIGPLGEALPEVVARNGSLPFRFDDSVHFLVPGGPDDRLRVAAAWERAPTSIPVHNGSPAAIVLAVRNPLDRSLRVGERDLPPGKTTQFRTPLSSARIDQVGEATSKLDFVLDGHSGSFAQRTWVVPDNPLKLLRYPRVNNSVPVRVTNPSGDAFRGAIVLGTTRRESTDDGEKERGRFPVSLAAGERERLVMVPITREMEDFAVHIALRDEQDRRIDGRGVGKEVPLALPADQVRAFADGAPGAKIEYHFAAAAPVDGPPFSGMPSLRITYRFEAGWSFLQMAPPAGTLLGSGRELGLWIYGDGRGMQPRLRFRDKTGQTFQADGPKIDWAKWRYVTFPLQSTEEKPIMHSGGANDGVIHYPIEWDAIFLLDNVPRQPIEGEIYLSAPTLIQ